MPNLLTKLILFLSSYLPLWLIFAVQFSAKNNMVGVWIAGGFAGLCLLGLFGYISKAKTINPVPLKIAGLNRRDGEAMSYIVSYLLPFIALPSSNASDLISLGIFIGVLAVLYVNSDMIHINPVLNLMSWHIYEVEKDSGQICTVISKQKIRINQEIQTGQIGDDLFIYFTK